MPSAVQPKLDFPVRKSSRISQKKAVIESSTSDVVSTPTRNRGKRSEQKNKENVEKRSDEEIKQGKTREVCSSKKKKDVMGRGDLSDMHNICLPFSNEELETDRKSRISSPRSIGNNVSSHSRLPLSPARSTNLPSSNAYNTPSRKTHINSNKPALLSPPYSPAYRSPTLGIANLLSKHTPRSSVQLTPCDTKSPLKSACSVSPRKVSRRIFDDSPPRPFRHDGAGVDLNVNVTMTSKLFQQPSDVESYNRPTVSHVKDSSNGQSCLPKATVRNSTEADGIPGVRQSSKKLLSSPCKREIVKDSVVTQLSPQKPDLGEPSPKKGLIEQMSIVTRSSPRKHAINAFQEMTSPPKCIMEQTSVVTRSSPQKFTNDTSSPFTSPRKRAILPDNPPIPPSPGINRSHLASPRKLLSPTKRPVLSLRRPDATAYQRAKQALHTALPDHLIGRDKEIEQVRKFITHRLCKGMSGSLYISGAPGTGKTAVVTHVLQNIQDNYKFTSVYINCMSLRDSAAIFTKVASDLTGKQTSCRSSKEAVMFLTKHFTTTGHNVLLILDEIDQLDSHKQDVLYTMFEWPSLPKSRLLLIGIANALDLTDRMLPRLQARPKCRPDLMNFTPYTKDQIIEILQDRLQPLNTDQGCVLEPSALQFCARKVSAVAGDLRKALDVCRRAVEMVEKDVKSQSILRTTGCPESPVKTNSAHALTKKINIKHISAVVAEVYSQNVTSSQDHQPLPLQQKLVVCSLLLMRRQTTKLEITVGKLHETYSRVCRKRSISSIDQSEFLSVCQLIETRGILLVKKAKDIRSSKIILKYDLDELEHALQDKMLISAILEENNM